MYGMKSLTDPDGSSGISMGSFNSARVGMVEDWRIKRTRGAVIDLENNKRFERQ